MREGEIENKRQDGGEGRGKNKMGQGYGDKQHALSDLGHNLLPFLF